MINAVVVLTGVWGSKCNSTERGRKINGWQLWRHSCLECNCITGVPALYRASVSFWITAFSAAFGPLPSKPTARAWNSSCDNNDKESFDFLADGKHEHIKALGFISEERARESVLRSGAAVSLHHREFEFASLWRLESKGWFTSLLFFFSFLLANRCAVSTRTSSRPAEVFTWLRERAVKSAEKSVYFLFCPEVELVQLQHADCFFVGFFSPYKVSTSKV